MGSSQTQTQTQGHADPAPWEKLLWRRHAYPDNHVPDTFLDELRQLRPRPRPSLTSLLFTALPVTQHLGVIAIFLAIFYSLLVGEVDAAVVGWACVLAGMTGYLLLRWGWSHHIERPERGSSLLPPPTPLRPLILPPLILSLLSPVLGTLTSATTSDSIWPLAGGLFFVHMLLGDFSTGPDARRLHRLKRREAWKRRGSVGQLQEVEEKSLTSSLSLTSALSASVVLASRLPSTSHVFALVLLAVGLFAGWPTLAKNVRESGSSFSLGLTISTLVLAISLFPPEPAPSLIFLSLVAVTNLLGPLMLWYGWRWKTKRGGGWDVARVKIRQRHR
ncbi:hypothetical protein JCM24511_00600 [Saitozyma sp. JCM 24511]|nr:hypothetical protein JCM24511_00600 [Saitozyma sp. JCM 24511]